MWGTYVRKLRLTAGDRQHDLGVAIGVTQETISRWETYASEPENGAAVAALARHYDRNPLEAFVAAGMLTRKEAGHAMGADSDKFLRTVRREWRQRPDGSGTGAVTPIPRHEPTYPTLGEEAARRGEELGEDPPII